MITEPYQNLESDRLQASVLAGNRHSRASRNPLGTQKSRTLDSRVRGNDDVWGERQSPEGRFQSLDEAEDCESGNSCLSRPLALSVRSQDDLLMARPTAVVLEYAHGLVR